MLQHPRIGNNQYLAIKLKAVKLSGIYSGWIIEEMQCTKIVANYVKKENIKVKISDWRTWCYETSQFTSTMLTHLCSRVFLKETR